MSKAAVDCIRVGLVKPSFVMPFLEPALPYYDSIRNQPEFEEMMIQIRESENIQQLNIIE